ncbi:hypothetical protein [Cupriavidus pauculus]|uniref:hypothetical protein n=1 Tax=Cupriavidus pauculus TaxID=82633 RepID=UPI0038577B72
MRVAAFEQVENRARGKTSVSRVEPFEPAARASSLPGRIAPGWRAWTVSPVDDCTSPWLTAGTGISAASLSMASAGRESCGSGVWCGISADGIWMPVMGACQRKGSSAIRV